MAVESMWSFSGSASLMVYEPRPGSSIKGRMSLTEPSSMTPAEAAEFLGHLADLRAWIAASEAIAIETVRRGFDEEAAAAARRAGQPERLSGGIDHALAVAEVAAAQGISEYAAARKVNAAEALGGPLMAVLEALESGDIAEADANVMVDQARELGPDDAELFAQEALRRVRTRTGRKRTASELRPVLKSLRERLHPETIRRRAARAAGDRGVWFRPEPDGMCTVSAFLPATTGLAVYAGVDGAARAARDAEPADPRTLPQLRADVLASALLSSAPAMPPTAANVHRELSDMSIGEGADGSIDDSSGECAGESVGGGTGEYGNGSTGERADGSIDDGSGECANESTGEKVQGDIARTDVQSHAVSFALPDPAASVGLKAEIVVLIPISTLLGSDNEAALLDGYGPIDADTARDLAVAAPTWLRLFTDADGVALNLGRSVYRPPKGLRRFITYRDGVCRFPGCKRPARRADADHIVEWQDGGMTNAENLQSLCKKHHALKSVGAWNASCAPDDEVMVTRSGDIRWKSPLGLEYRTGPTEYSTIPITRETERHSPALAGNTRNDDPASLKGLPSELDERLPRAECRQAPGPDRDDLPGQDHDGSSGHGGDALAGDGRAPLPRHNESPPPF